MKWKKPFLSALCEELKQRKDYLDKTEIQTIYFGGGTPSQLDPSDFECIFDAISRNYHVSPHAEITLEANPDDMTVEYANAITRFPFNRISMGVQSFNDQDLQFLNRRHTAEGARLAVQNVRKAGFENISIDLIYGLPHQTLSGWQNNLTEALELKVPHLSAYHLIYEEKTALYRLWQSGKVNQVSEEASLSFFKCLIKKAKETGYEHYEISNFALPGQYSKHNSSYWNGTPYIGVGPSAHSFDGKSRQWNVRSLPKYIQGIETHAPAFEREELDVNTRYNEFVLTGLRTMWGLNLDLMDQLFTTDSKRLRDYLRKQAMPYISNHTLQLNGNQQLKLTEAGVFISDGIITDLLWV